MRPSTLQAIAAELDSARAKFPSAMFLTLALAEESGEAVKAALDYRQGKGSAEALKRECIQTAAMAIRLLEEGDPALFALADYLGSDPEEPVLDVRVIPQADGFTEAQGVR